MKYQSVFPDRNGTIGGDGHFIHPRDFEPYTNFYQASLSQKHRAQAICLYDPTQDFQKQSYH